MDRRTLTEREIEVVRLAAKGQTNPEIAEELGVSVATVKRHLANVMIKWNLRNRIIVALEARARGLVPDPPRGDDDRPAPKRRRKGQRRRAQKRSRRKG